MNVHLIIAYLEHSSANVIAAIPAGLTGRAPIIADRQGLADPAIVYGATRPDFFCRLPANAMRTATRALDMMIMHHCHN